MNILLLTTHLNIGGVAVYTVNLAKGLKNKGHDVFVASSGGELATALKTDGITHIRVNAKTKFEFNPKLILAFWKLLKFVKKNDIKIIHAQTRVSQILAYFLAKSSGAKFVSTCHGFFKYGRLGRRLFGAWGDRTIAISDAVYEHLIRDFKLKKENVFMIYNGVDIEKFSKSLAGEEKKALKTSLGFEKSAIIGSVSRFSPVKGLRYLLFAMKDVLSDIPDARLLLVGEGPSKEYLMELARKLGIEKNVFFAQSTTETGRFLSIIDIFVFYSLEEGLGLSLLEAMAAGRPCVASNVGGVSSIIKDGVTGILVPSKDPHALKEAIVKLYTDEKLRNSIAKKGMEHVRKNFSLGEMVEKVIEVYEK